MTFRADLHFDGSPRASRLSVDLFDAILGEVMAQPVLVVGNTAIAPFHNNW